MTRKDYEYVDKASCLCLTTTPKGHAWLSKQMDKEVTEDIPCVMVDLLAMIEQDYIIIPSGACFNEISEAVYNFAKDEYQSPTPYAYGVEIIQAFITNLIGIKKVIWDES